MDGAPCPSCNGSGKIEISRWVRRAALPYVVILGISGAVAVLAASSPKNGPGAWAVVGGGCAALLLGLYWLEGGIVTLFHRLYQFYRWTFKGQAPDCRNCGGKGVLSTERSSRWFKRLLLGGFAVVVIVLAACWIVSRGWFKI